MTKEDAIKAADKFADDKMESFKIFTEKVIKYQGIKAGVVIAVGMRVAVARAFRLGAGVSDEEFSAWCNRPDQGEKAGV